MSNTIGSPVSSNIIGAISYGPTPPTVSNVAIRQTSAYVIGAVIGIEQYVYEDINGDIESGSTLKWYSGSSDTGPWTLKQTDNVISANYLIPSYTVLPGNSYIRIGITPATSVAPQWGTEVFSDAIGGVDPIAPVANQLAILLDNIDGSVYVGTTLLGRYNYVDDNGDPEDGTIIKWYRGDSIIGPWTIINESTTTASVGSSYTLVAEDMHKYIMFGVTPKNLVNPNTGDESTKVFYSEIQSIPTPPVVSNIVIKELVNDALVDIGSSVYPGNILIATYDYYDENGDLEDKSDCIWFRIPESDPNSYGEVILGIDGKIHNSTRYIATEKDRGYFLAVEVTPRSL